MKKETLQKIRSCKALQGKTIFDVVALPRFVENLGAYWTAQKTDRDAIRVGYQDNYLAFCAADDNGQLIGALKDYLDYASTSLENAHLFFEATAYPSAGAAMEAL